MRDDERYPTVVEPEPGSNAPEAVPNQNIDPEGNAKFAATSPSNASVTPGVTAQSGLIPKYDTAGMEVVGENHGKTEPRKYCGMKRKTFLIAMAVLAVVIIAAVVGGVVGGLKSKSNSDDGDTPASTTSAIMPPSQTGPIDANERRLAVAASSDDNNQNIQVFYNDLDTTDILYRRVKNDEAGDEHKVDLDIKPNWGAPLAAAAINGSRPLSLQLFYINTTSDGKTNVVQATLSCNAMTTAACTTKSNSIISSNVTAGVHVASKLAALRLGNDSDPFIRVWFQRGDEEVRALNGDSASSDGWTTVTPIQDVFPGSDIVGVGPNSTQISFWFVSNQTRNMRYTPYNDIGGIPEWNSLPVDSNPGSSWAASDSLAGVYVPNGSSLRIFYANSRTGKIASYFRSAGETTWSANTDDDSHWGKAEGGLASTAWPGEVRLFYFESGKLVMSAQHGSTWDDPKDLS
ncbi:Fc.00g014840.m01.CDS01 [Cosmosporella sp. VM-42]